MNRPISGSARITTPLRLWVAMLLLGGLLLAACASSSATATVAPEPASQVPELPDAAEELPHTEDAEEHEHGAEEEQEHSETEGSERVAEEEHEHSEEEEHEHSTGETHGVPEEAAAVPNPIGFSDESVDIGRMHFSVNCAVCHGETGEGDGPSAAGLDPKPANLHESHVQDLSDGALFHIITHGVPDTAMPAWEEQLSEDERWHLVNFIRSFVND